MRQVIGLAMPVTHDIDGDPDIDGDLSMQPDRCPMDYNPMQTDNDRDGCDDAPQPPMPPMPVARILDGDPCSGCEDNCPTV